MVYSKRLFHGSSAKYFKLKKEFKLKCGIEIHTQLKTKYKLFSLSASSFDSKPNSNVSFFDSGLPGTFPRLNPEALYLGLKAACALNSDIQGISTFDRKHYFYPDQPLGYQITQFYHPLAKNGQLELTSEFDGISSQSKTINIERIQLEQDTGKSNYNKFDKTIQIDLNRNNIPLIELVTKPDFENFEQVRAFLKKYQTLVKYLGICSGSLENGAIRVDVNISINGNNRVELKNLGSTGEIHEALSYEYNRQIRCIEEGIAIEQETRGWNGRETLKLRSKEDSFDYRYVPDSELPRIILDKNIGEKIKEKMPEMPEIVLKKLTMSPFNLELKHAKFLIDNQELLQYYYKIFDLIVIKNKKESKYPNNWLIHELIGCFNKFKLKIDVKLIPPEMLSEIILRVLNDEISSTSAKYLLSEIVRNQDNSVRSITSLIEKYDLGKPKDISSVELDEAIEEVCIDIISQNSDVVSKIRKGKKGSIKYLVGLCMRETQGKVSSKIIEQKLIDLIN